MAQQSIPSNIGTGLVTGRFIVGVADSTDPDSEPDGIPARGRIVFTPAPPYLPAPGSSDGSLTVLQVPITAVLDAQGTMCAPDLLNPGEAGDPGLRLIAADTPTILVNGWTYKVEYFFEMVNNVIPKIPAHEIEVLTGAVIDLTSVVKVPESPGIGEDQAAVLIAMAQAAADRAEIAAAAAAVAAQEAADAAQGAADATASPTPSTIALRDTDGALTGTQLISSETVPTLPEHVTRKDYVDAGIAGRAPAVHRHTYGDIDGQVPTSALPPLAVIDTFTAATQTAMLALTAQRGDMAIRTDISKTFVLAADTPTVLSAWKEVMAAGQVTSVNNKTGTVSLGKADIGLGNADNTTDIDKPLSTANQTALAGKSDVGHTHDITAITGLSPRLAAAETTITRLAVPIALGDTSINSIVDTGEYTQASTAPVTTANGYPLGATAAGHLRLESFGGSGNSFRIQTYTQWGSRVRMWKRSTSNAGSTWAVWNEFTSP